MGGSDSKEDGPRGQENDQGSGGGFFCGSNKTERKITRKKNKARASDSVIVDYEDMIKAGLEKQKEIKNSANNQIRDTYMNKLNMRPSELEYRVTTSTN